MVKKKTPTKMGRPSREEFNPERLQALITALNDRADKLQSVIVGMQALGLESINVAETIAMKDGLDGVRRFCDDALEVLRGQSKYGERPWDKWGI
jgi:hypothetical protein